MADLQENKNGVHVLTKRIGETPLQCIGRYKNEHPEFAQMPMTYAGRLDPMAEGILLVLSGDAIKQKESYLDLPKGYECEILWGISTDTLDVLGLVGSESYRVPNQADLNNIIKNKIGSFTQKYPAYSSQPVKGKPLFQWSREGKLEEVKIPSHEVEIFDAAFLSRREISQQDLLEQIISKINLMSGDFRQDEIIKSWKEHMGLGEQMFVIDKISIRVSSGFYVRQFVTDIATQLGTCALAFSIRRTQIGDFYL